MGLPVFAGGFSGPGLLFGPTAGFALAFPLAAFICGLAAYQPKAYKYILYGALASIFISLAGILGLHINLKVSWQKALFITIPFLPGDGFKVIASAAIMTGGGEFLRRRLGAFGSKKSPENQKAGRDKS
jgi:biotin transport system substrate-specific component